MSAKKFSAAAGFLLLICSVVGIFIVIYGTETYSTSSGSSSSSTAGRRIEVEESLTLLHDRSISKTHPKTVNGSKIGTNKNDLKTHQPPSSTSTNGPGNHNHNHRNMNKKDSFKPGASKDGIKLTVTNSNPNSNPNINTHTKTDTNMPPVRTTAKPRKPHERNGISSSHSNFNSNSNININSNEHGHGHDHGAHSMEKPKVLGMRIDSGKVNSNSNSNSKFQLPSPAQPMPMTVTMPMPMPMPIPMNKPTTTLKTGQRPEQMNWNEFAPSPWSPLTVPNGNLRVPLNQRILSPGESLVTKTTATTNTNNRRPPPTSQSHLAKPGSDSSSSSSSSVHLNTYNSLEQELTSQEVQSGEEPYNSHSDRDPDPDSDSDLELEWEDEEDEQEGGGGGERDEFHVGQLFDLATHLYESGTNASDIQEFLRVINETVNKGNNSDLLTKLNELYSRPESKSDSDLQADLETETELQDASSLKKSKSSPTAVAMGRNTMETSLTAFVFMSFGVFLLNQIHSFIGKDKTKGQGLRSQQARSFLGFGGGGGNSLMDEPEQSNLEILFNSPPGFGFGSDSNSKVNSTWYEIALEKTKPNNKDKEEDGYWRKRNETEIGIQSNSKKNLITSSSNSSSGYVNNMFRALLNLVNAYTRNTQVLECIWSLYCQDLDRTSNNTGLYGMAARINSIGLRLIMDQIPAELTMDVLLRSMLGWDGLPCAKMFNKCKPEAAASTLLSATSDKKP